MSNPAMSDAVSEALPVQDSSVSSTKCECQCTLCVNLEGCSYCNPKECVIVYPARGRRPRFTECNCVKRYFDDHVYPS